MSSELDLPIAAGHFPFVPASSGGIRPPYHAPAFDSLPSELREMFGRSFTAGCSSPASRFAASAWVDALDRAEKTLTTCSKGHAYFREARKCPTCDIADSLVSCAHNPAHKRYYRDQGECPQCVTERRRAARGGSVAAPPAGPPAVARTTLPRTPAPTRVAAPPAATSKSWFGALLGSPLLLRWGIAAALLALFGGFRAIQHTPSQSTQAQESRSAPVAAQHIHTQTRENSVDGAVEVLIPAGEFKMGDDDQNDNKPRTVRLAAYWMYEDPVTVGQYRKFCDATKHSMPDGPDFDKNWSELKHPIVNVSWNDAKAYADWAHVRLPTEQEWEKAARGTDGRKYPWGNHWDASKCANSVGGNHLSGTVEVGKFTDSPYGLSDMAGNVWQWCSDWYDSSQSARVLRGGSWYGDYADDFRASGRYIDYVPVLRYFFNGFRCAAGQ